MASWLVKTEPSSYAFADLAREKRTAWTGVKNPAAQANLRAMKVGEQVVVYHTGGEKAAVGLARVAKAAYPEPGAEGRSCVELAAGKALSAPVPLAALKSHPAFAGSPLLRQGRLSVVPLTEPQLEALVGLGEGQAGR